MADKALADKDHAGARRWLKAAGDSVDEVAGWTERSPSGAQAEAWDQMHAFQAQIRTSANWSYDEAKKGVGYLGAQVQYLGQLSWPAAAELRRLGRPEPPELSVVPAQYQSLMSARGLFESHE